MNLGKLLSAGKTFFGGKDTLCYRRNRHVYLPKFNPDRNPFPSKPVASAPAAALKMEKTATPVVARVEKIFAPAAARPVHATSWKTRLNPFHAPAPVAPPNLGAMQPELSLAAVKPVANDLADADIEIVPAKSQTVTAVMTEAAPVVPLLKPARQAWEFLGERLVKPV